jgi:Protein of unknown function (DUF2934)
MARKSNPENDFVVSSQGATAGSRRKSSKARKHMAVPAETPAGVTSVEETPETPVTAMDIPAAATVTGSAVYEPTHEEIAERAYLLWEARGCQGGCPEEDWLRAEEELRQQRTSTAIA